MHVPLDAQILFSCEEFCRHGWFLKMNRGCRLREEAALEWKQDKDLKHISKWTIGNPRVSTFSSLLYPHIFTQLIRGRTGIPAVLAPHLWLFPIYHNCPQQCSLIFENSLLYMVDYEISVLLQVLLNQHDKNRAHPCPQTCFSFMTCY